MSELIIFCNYSNNGFDDNCLTINDYIYTNYNPYTIPYYIIKCNKRSSSKIRIIVVITCTHDDCKLFDITVKL